jgi:hypothetical protein
MTKLYAMAFALTLTACSPQVVYRDRVQTVSIPVAQPCATTRPAHPGTLESRTPDWADLDVRQKAAWVGRHGLDLRTYGEQLDAATAGCPEAGG